MIMAIYIIILITIGILIYTKRHRHVLTTTTAINNTVAIDMEDVPPHILAMLGIEEPAPIATGKGWLFTYSEIEDMFEQEMDIESMFTPNYSRMIEIELEKQGFVDVSDNDIPDSVKRLMFGEVTIC